MWDELRSSKGSQDSETVSTCYFGTSDKVVRFYNAEKVHEILADRWELQARGEYAEKITSLIRETKPENLAKIQASLVTHAIDFIRRGETWRDEKRYYFWEKLREGTEEIKLKGINKEYSIEKSAKWIDKQVCAALTVFYEGFGRANYLKYMEAVAIRGKERLNPKQQAIIAYLKRESQEIYLNLPERKKL